MISVEAYCRSEHTYGRCFHLSIVSLSKGISEKLLVILHDLK